jgi:hypothetical protein
MRQVFSPVRFLGVFVIFCGCIFAVAYNSPENVALRDKSETDRALAERAAAEQAEKASRAAEDMRKAQERAAQVSSNESNSRQKCDAAVTAKAREAFGIGSVPVLVEYAVQSGSDSSWHGSGRAYTMTPLGKFVVPFNCVVFSDGRVFDTVYDVRVE